MGKGPRQPVHSVDEASKIAIRVPAYNPRTQTISLPICDQIARLISVQSLSRVWLFVTLWAVACQASLSITSSQSLLKLMSIKSVMPSNHLILCCPLLYLPSMFPSIRVFSSKSVLPIRWPKYWSFSFSIVFPMNIQDWFPLGLIGLMSFQSKGVSKVFSNTTIQKHQFFGAQLSL